MTIRDAITGRVVGEVYCHQGRALTLFGGEWRNQAECRRESIVAKSSLGWAFQNATDARHELMAWDLERVGEEEKS